MCHTPNNQGSLKLIAESYRILESTQDQVMQSNRFPQPHHMIAAKQANHSALCHFLKHWWQQTECMYKKMANMRSKIASMQAKVIQMAAARAAMTALTHANTVLYTKAHGNRPAQPRHSQRQQQHVHMHP